MSQLLPWQDLLRFSLGTLRIAPEVFWRMTPAELAAAMQGFAENTIGAKHALPVLNRDELTRLMHAHPDRSPDNHAGT